MKMNVFQVAALSLFLSGSVVHAMQMGDAQSSKQSIQAKTTCLNTCCDVIKKGFYLGAVLCLMTSAQPVNGQAGHVAPGHAAAEDQFGNQESRVVRLEGCRVLGTTFVVGGLTQGGALMQGHANPHFMAQCYADAVRDSYSQNYLLGHVAEEDKKNQ